MGVAFGAHELEIRPEGKIATEFFVEKPEFVAGEPDIVSGTFYKIGFGSRVISRVSFQFGIANVFSVCKDANRPGLCVDSSKTKGKYQDGQYDSHNSNVGLDH
jgi:hypothetical protein